MSDPEGVREAVVRVIATLQAESRTIEDARRLFPGFDHLVDEEWARRAAAAKPTPAKPTTRRRLPSVLTDEDFPSVDATPAPPAVETARAVAPPPAPRPSTEDEPAARTPSPTVARVAATPSPGPRRIGAYRVVRDLGHGGMGVVLLAEDERLGRLVALKVIAPGFAESVEARARFRREAEAAARLDHPGICTVYETGEHEGVPFLAMRFVEGRTLAACLAGAHEAGLPLGSLGLPGETPAKSSSGSAAATSAGRRHGLDATLLLVEKIARALHAAHESGVIHRDVKPANVMVKPDGEPVILDFGLARPDSLADTGLTAPGALVGTPAYVSPEALVGRFGPVDRRSDVYSLGVLLHECVTGELPFAAPTLNALYEQIMTTEPPDARRGNRAVSADLSVVIRTAMEKDRARRYQSALDLAEDLRRVRMREPILARPVGPVTRLHRWAQRRPALSAALLLALTLLVGGLATTSFLWRRADEFRLVAEDRERAAASSAADLRVKNDALVEEEKRTQAARDAARAEALVAASEAEDDESQTLSLLLASEAARIPGALAKPTVLRRLSSAVHASSERAEVRRPGLAVTAAAFSPAGDRFAAAFADGEVLVYGPGVDAPLPLTGHRDVVARVRFFPAGDRLLTASWDGAARVWNAADGRELALLAPDAGRVLAADVAPDGSLVVTAHEDGTARLWTRDGAPRAVLSAHRGWVTHALFSPDGARVATCAADRVVRLFERDGRPAREFRGHARRIASARFLPDGRLVTADYGGQVLGWDAAADAPARFAARGRLLDAAESGDRIAVAGEEGVSVVEWPSGAAPRPPSAVGAFEVTSVAFVPGGDGALVTGDQRGSVRLWSASGAPVRALCTQTGPVRALTFARDGTKLLSASDDETARLTDLRGAGRAVVTGPGGGVFSACFSPTRDEFVVGCGDGTVRVHGLDGETTAEMRGHAGPVLCVRFTSDGGRVVSGGRDGTARIWSREGGLLATLDGGAGPVLFVRCSPDGTHLLTIAEARGESAPRKEGEPFPRTESEISRSVGRIWTADGSLAASFPLEGPNCVEFFPDGRRVVIGVGRPLIMDMAGAVLATLPGHEGRLGEIAVSHDGARVATSGPDLRVRVCDDAGAAVREVRGTWSFVGALAFAPRDRRLLVTGPGSRRASVWDDDGRMVLALGPFEDTITSGEFSRDGTRIVVGSETATGVWDEGGEQTADLRGHGDSVWSSRFSFDGRHVLTTSSDGTARTWAVDGAVLTDLARRRATRSFLPEERARYAELLGLDRDVERAAKRLVDSILARRPLPAEAALEVRADATLAPALRERALALLADSRIDADVLASLAWFDARYEGPSAADYARDLSWIEAARRIVPGDPRLCLYRGVALYRVGRLAEARLELRRGVDFLASLGSNRTRDLAYLALTAWRLGDRAEFDRLLPEIRGSNGDDPPFEADDPQYVEFVRTTGADLPATPAQAK